MELCPFDIALKNAGVQHKLIPPRTPWHNGKVERSHQNDQRYFYNWEKFASVEDLNRKLKDHLRWSNRKPMRTLGDKSPLDLLREILSNDWFFSIPLFFTFCGSYLFTTQNSLSFICQLILTISSYNSTYFSMIFRFGKGWKNQTENLKTLGLTVIRN